MPWSLCCTTLVRTQFFISTQKERAAVLAVLPSADVLLFGAYLSASMYAAAFLAAAAAAACF